jgi:hypothetical protein
MRPLAFLAPAALLLTLGACASAGGANTAAAPSWFDGSATPITGWIRVTGEEFSLYEAERDLRGPSLDCVSGALPRDLQRAAGDLNGAQVRIYGRVAPWSDRRGMLYDWRGSKIHNDCRRDVVILADRMEAIQ